MRPHDRDAMTATIAINRAPVLTLWAAVVAKRLGFKWDEALTLGRAVAGLNAYSKGVSLGLIEPTPDALREAREKARRGAIKIALMHRAVPAVRTSEGIRALDKEKPGNPESVARYLEGKFKDHYDDAKAAMEALARSMPPKRLAAEAYRLYEEFRPSVPAGVSGWGAAGKLDLARIRKMAGEKG
jgi:hypothetical protein